MKNYVHTQKGTRATVVKEKEFAVVLEMEDTKEQKEMSLNTLKRWWKLADEESTATQFEPEQSTEVNTTSDTENSDMDAQDAPGDVTGEIEPMKMSETVATLENLFDNLNTIYFEGKLPKPVITVQSTPKAYGHCTTKKIWKSDETAQYEINIGAEYINRQMPNTAETLLHEMIHLYCRENDISETSQKGRYHNGTFKKEAEARDLKVGYDRANGHTYTEPTEAFITKLTESGFDTTIRFARITPSKKASSERVKAHKYVCPLCGQEVKTTAELSLICGVCEVPMDLEV